MLSSERSTRRLMQPIVPMRSSAMEVQRASCPRRTASFSHLA
jgi:hypothetical protein